MKDVPTPTTDTERAVLALLGLTGHRVAAVSLDWRTLEMTVVTRRTELDSRRLVIDPWTRRPIEETHTVPLQPVSTP